MLAICPVCEKLVPVTNAGRDQFDRPRVKVAHHESSNVTEDELAPKRAAFVVACAGSDRKI